MKTLALLAALVSLIAGPALAQSGGTGNNAVAVWGQDSNTGLPCIIAPAPLGSVTCGLPNSQVVTSATFVDAAIGTIGSAAPTGAENIGVTVAGVLQNPTGVNPSGSIFAEQVDLASILGATVKVGNGTATGALRVALASDNSDLHVIVDTIPTTAVTCALCATSAKQDTGNTALAAIQSSAAASATAAKQPALGTAGTPSSDVITVQGVSGGTALPVTPTGYSYAHIASNTTTLVKSGAGVLHAVCINTKGATGNTATVDDALTATTPTIAIIDATAAAGCQVYDASFSTGLTIVTGTGTAGDFTAIYR